MMIGDLTALATPETETGHGSLTVVGPDGPDRSRVSNLLERCGLMPSAVAQVGDLDTQASGADVVVLTAGNTRAACLAELREARNVLPADVAIVVVWPERDDRGARSALAAGAAAVIPSARVEAMLAPAIAAVSVGLVCVEQPMRRCIESSALSMRERQILRLLVMGSTNGEIARKLFLAESTVKSHLSSAYTKLGVGSRKDAADLILEPGGRLGAAILGVN